MIEDVSSGDISEHNRLWASTMAGFDGAANVTTAHADSHATISSLTRSGGTVDGSLHAREEQLRNQLSEGATLVEGAGHRAIVEEPDLYRTCFERDRDRILHSTAFRRLAGKTQVFVFPDDHMRTRLTHALEVAQVAVGVARPVGLNAALAEAIAIGHDCGHGPGGHASEEALDPYVEGGFNHATWGADVALAPLNLCAETLDGIRNHSWSRPAPSTPEGEIVSWADRIAYVCHDFEDAVSAGIVTHDQLPAIVRERCGSQRGQQLGSFINAMIRTIQETGVIGMNAAYAEALAAFRTFNYETIYLRGASKHQAGLVVSMLRGLVEHFTEHPELIIDEQVSRDLASTPEALAHAVSYVAGMTDRFACQAAIRYLSWPTEQLPSGIDR
jgi:dGTPase